MKFTLIRSASTSGKYTSISRTKKEGEENNINEGLSLLMKREPEGNKILVCFM